MRLLKNNQSGQAMTEMTVSLVALIPVFLLIPMLGKYTDIKHSTIQAARYEAWEYTTWYRANSDRPFGYTKRQPVKSLRDTRNEARSRFFSNSNSPLTAGDTGGWNVANVNPLWRDHRALPLYQGGVETGSHQSNSDKVPDVAGDTVGDTLGIIDNFFTAMENEISWASPGPRPPVFTGIRDKGYFTSRVQIPVQTAAAFAPKIALRSNAAVAAPQNLQFSAQAAVLADGWNSGGREYTHQQSKSLSTTPLLKDATMRFLQNTVGSVLPSPELRADQLQWGYMKPDVVHPDRLSGGGKHYCGEGYLAYGWRDHGICSYVP